MKVKYSYLEEQYKDHDEIFKELENLIRTGDYTFGKTVQEFEQKFAILIGTRYAVGQ